MPPAVVAAGIGGVTQLAGGLIGAHGQGKARQAQTRANQEAMAYQRERDTEERRRYDQRYDAFTQEKAAYDARKRAILAHYGISLPDAPSAAPMASRVDGAGVPSAGPGMAPGGSAPGPAHMPAGPGVVPSGGASLTSLMSGAAPGMPPGPMSPEMPPDAGAPVAAPMPPRAGKLTDLAEPINWRNYGV